MGDSQMISREIEKVFREDIREKRKTGSGAFHKRGKGVKHGFRGALRTPYYFMTNKEKKALNGEVEVSFMYETVIPYEEFQLKNRETQKAMLTRWREIFDNEFIKTEMGLYNKSYYDLVSDLGVPKKERRPRTNNKKETSQKVAAMSPSKTTELKLVDSPVKEKLDVEEKQEKIFGLDLNYNQICDVEELSRILTKFQLMVEGEPTNFKVEISIKQVPKEKQEEKIVSKNLEAYV